MGERDMGNALIDGFLYKAARRREIEEISKGNLSEASIARIVENNRGMKHERFIKPIGTGGTQQADLVLHPKHGIVVRKNVRYPTNVSALANHPNITIMDEIRKYQDKHGPSGFGRVHEVSPGSSLIFQEYVKGKPVYDAGGKKRTVEIIEREGHRDRLGAFSTEDAIKRQQRVEALRTRAYSMAHRRVPMTTEQSGLVNHLKRTYPAVYDYNRAPNVIRTNAGNVIIDVSGDTVAPVNQSFIKGPTKFDQFKWRRIMDQRAADKEVIPLSQNTTTRTISRSKKPYILYGLAGAGLLGAIATSAYYKNKRDAMGDNAKAASA